MLFWSKCGCTSLAYGWVEIAGAFETRALDKRVAPPVLGIHDSAVIKMARRKGHAVSNGRRHNVDVHAERLVGNIGKDMQDSNGRPLHTGSVDPCASLERHTVVGVGFVHVGRLDPELKHVAEAEDSGCKPAIVVRVRDY